MQTNPTSRRLAILALLLVAAAPATITASGRLEGRLTGPDNAGVEGVRVSVNETGHSTVTDREGRFGFDVLPAGVYTVTFSSDTNTLVERDVRIDNGTVRLDRSVDWRLGYAETMTVHAASFRTQRLLDVPAAVAVVDASAIALEAPQAQVPRALDSVVGVQVAQTGMFDYNVNARGVTTAVNRRVLTLLDGRDAASVLVGAQEWVAVALPMDEIGRIEVVRGPASALYGQNALNGVIDMTSREPKYSPGGSLQLSIGEHDTARVSMRHAGALAPDWFYRGHAAYGRTGDFFVSRDQTVEYPGLPAEAVPLATDRTEFVNMGGRLDRYFSESQVLTFEGGWAKADGNVFVTGAGRPQNRDVHRPWGRIGFQTSRWRASGYYDGRKGEMLSLATGQIIVDDSMRLHFEGQRRFDAAAGRVKFVVGGGYRYEWADTRDGNGVPTLLRNVEDATSGGLFGQIDYDVGTRLKLVGAARFDGSTLHSPQLSPKAAAVVAVSPEHSIRFTYGRAFQTATFVQYFSRVAAAPPVTALAALETALAPALGGVPLNFGSVPVLVLGNENMEVERSDSFETGYSGVIGSRVLVGATYYFNFVDRLIALMPQVGTSFGRVNPEYGPYEPPAALSPAQRGLVLASLQSVLTPDQFARLSNDRDDSPIAVAASYANLSPVHVQGVELSARVFAGAGVTGDIGLSWLDFAPTQDLPDDTVSANVPPYMLTAGMAYAGSRVSLGVRYRWSDDFNWTGGIFNGPVAGYGVVSVSAGYQLPRRMRAMVNAANVFDNEHYEMFGGDLLPRSVLFSIMRDW